VIAALPLEEVAGVARVGDDVVACAAADEIDTVAALDAIVAIAAPDSVVAVATDDGVVAGGAAHDHVLTAGEAEIVGVRTGCARIVALDLDAQRFEERIIRTPSAIGRNLGGHVHLENTIVLGK